MTDLRTIEVLEFIILRERIHKQHQISLQFSHSLQRNRPGMYVSALSLCLALVTLHNVVARCPNSCNGHGKCGTSNICACYPPWDGGAADCSARVCPFGRAWADKAYAADIAHQSAECSNAGFCDRETGNCKCFAGFTGNACQRSVCPADCSGHGVCSTIGDVSLYEGPDYDPTFHFSGDGFGPQYINWDKNSIQLCECDQGFFGADCSRAMCPKGDDPLTVNQNYRTLQMRVQTSDSYDLEGRLGLEFMGSKVMLTLTATPATRCTQEIAFQGNFGNVGCTATQVDRYTLDFTFTFYSWPTFPKTNNLYSHDGNPSKLDFFCDLTHVTAYTTCKFTDIEATNIQEYVHCSNRGLCDFATGDCKCHEGFGGPACANVTYLSHHGDSTLPGSQINVDSLDYVSSALQITTAKAGASDFNMIEALAAGEVVFFVRGDGTVGINKLLTQSGGQTIGGGGLFVASGGVTIASTGLSALSADDTDPVMFLSSTYAGPLGSAYSALRLKMATSTPSQARAIEVLNQGQRRFAVRSDGHVIIYNGGAEVTGGVTIHSRGLQVSGGVTVNNAGVRVPQSGVEAAGGVTVTTGGVAVVSGGVTGVGGVSVYSGGLRVSGGATILAAPLSVTGGLTVTTNGVQVTGGLTVQLRGLNIVTQGVTIQAGGLQVSAGGLTVLTGGMRLTGGITVTAGGVEVTGGVTVTTGGLNVIDGGLTVTAGGLTVTVAGASIGDGLTVASGGLYLTASGLSILDGGLSVTGGMSARNLGMRVLMDGITVGAGGMSVTNGGITVTADGLSVTGGLSVQANGIRVTDGMTVVTLGLRVTGGTTFSSGGLDITDGYTVATGGLYATQDGLSVTGGGMTVVGGATISTGGLYITDGFTVAVGGLRTQGGVTVASSGLRVQASGVTIDSGGLTVSADGASLSGGLTIVNAGLTVTAGGLLVSADGVTVTNGGLTVTNDGLSVASGGIRVTGGATVASNGLTITADGVSVVAGGATVAGGLTVSTGGLYITNNGVTVANGGISIAGGGLILSGGLSVENTGMQVKGGGIQVTNGVTINTGGLDVILGGLGVIGGAVVSNGLTVYGNAMVSDTITQTSDRRLKRDVAPIDDALAKVNKLNGVYFNWIQDEPNGIQFDDKRHVGVLAQEVLHVLPEVVSNIHGGKYLGVDYASMVPLIIEAVRELDELFQAGRISAEEKARHTETLFAQLQERMASMKTRLAAVYAQLAEVRELLAK